MIPKWFDLNKEEQVEKFKYNYGIRDVQLRYKDYSRASTFVSKPYNINNNILGVSLQVEENIPLISENEFINPYQGSIEYYVSFDKDEAKTQWLPIMPENCDKIENELIIMSSNIGNVRFSPDVRYKISVYKNSILIHPNTYTIKKSSIIFNDFEYSPKNIYTISYIPTNVAEAKLLKVPDTKKEIKEIIEVFDKGTDAFGRIKLSNTPYINIETLQTETPIKVYLESDHLNDSYFRGYPIESALYKAITPYGPILKGEDYNSNLSTFGKSNSLLFPATRNMTDYISGITNQLKLYDNNPSYLVVDPQADTTWDDVLQIYTTPSYSSISMANPYFEYIHDKDTLNFANTFNYIAKDDQIIPSARITVIYKTLNVDCRLKIILRNTSNDITTTPKIKHYALIFKVKE